MFPYLRMHFRNNTIQEKQSKQNNEIKYNKDITIKHNKTNKLFSSIVTLHRVRDITTHHIV